MSVKNEMMVKIGVVYRISVLTLGSRSFQLIFYGQESNENFSVFFSTLISTLRVGKCFKTKALDSSTISFSPSPSQSCCCHPPTLDLPLRPPADDYRPQPPLATAAGDHSFSFLPFLVSSFLNISVSSLVDSK